MQTPRSISTSIAVIASGITICGALTAAQAAPPAAGAKPGPGMRRSATKMVSDLNLTEAQKTQAKALEADMKKQRAAIEGNKALTPDQKKTKMRAAMVASMGKMMAILTPEQKQMLQKKMMERRSSMMKMQGKPGMAPGAPKP